MNFKSITALVLTLGLTWSVATTHARSVEEPLENPSIEYQALLEFIIPFLTQSGVDIADFTVQFNDRFGSLTSENDEDLDVEDEDEFEDEDYDFATEKQEILEELTQELDYIEDVELQAQVQQDIGTLTVLEDEDEFFDALDKTYEIVDRYRDEFEDEDYDFATEKTEIIEELRFELSDTDNDRLQLELAPQIDALEALDEDAFDQAINTIYETLDQYWESHEDDFENEEGDHDLDFDDDEDESDDDDQDFEDDERDEDNDEDTFFFRF